MSDKSNLSFEENVLNTVQNVIADTRIALPCKVLSFDGIKVNVQPLTKITKTVGDKETFVEFPVIENVPVIIPYAQSLGLSLTLPLSAGDNGLLIISDRELSSFVNGDGLTPKQPYKQNVFSNTRSRNLKDAIYIPGLSPNSKSLSVDTSHIELRNKVRSIYISLGEDGIKLTENSTELSLQNGNVTLKTSGNFSVECGGAFTVSSSNFGISASGNAVNSVGTFVDNRGIQLGTHVHGGIYPGTGNTSGPR